MTGEPLSFLRWGSGQPNNGAGSGEEDFVETNLLGWNDEKNNVSQPYIVEYERRFDIKFTSFIPSDWIQAPFFHPDRYCFLFSEFAVNRYFNGNDRTFDPSIDTTETGAFKTMQKVSVIPASWVDSNGLVDGVPIENVVGETKAFASDALADGDLNAADEDAEGDCHLLDERATASRAGMLIEAPVYLADDRISVRLTTNQDGPADPLVLESPSIDWDIDITIDSDGYYEVSGTWDGFPAAELYINGQEIYTFTPGPGPYSDITVTKLYNGYGDTTFFKRGRIVDSTVSTQGVPESRTATTLLIAGAIFVARRRQILNIFDGQYARWALLAAFVSVVSFTADAKAEFLATLQCNVYKEPEDPFFEYEYILTNDPSSTARIAGFGVERVGGVIPLPSLYPADWHPVVDPAAFGFEVTPRVNFLLNPGASVTFTVFSKSSPRFQDYAIIGSDIQQLFGVAVLGGVAGPTPDADFNLDTRVDGRDFLVWQRNVGRTSGALFSQGDSNHDEKIDVVDFDNWLTESTGFGMGTTPASVPEPSSHSVAQWAFLAALLGQPRKPK